jgi:hypothetical protein
MKTTVIHACRAIFLVTLILVVTGASATNKRQKAFAIGLAYPIVLTDYSALYQQGRFASLPALAVKVNAEHYYFDISFNNTGGWSVETDRPNTNSLLPNTVLARESNLIQISVGRHLTNWGRLMVTPLLLGGASFTRDYKHTHYFMNESKVLSLHDFPGISIGVGLQVTYSLSQRFAAYCTLAQHRRIFSIPPNGFSSTSQINMLWGQAGFSFKLGKKG